MINRVSRRAVLLLTLATATAHADGARVQTRVRPPECGLVQSARLNAWERLKRSRYRLYCDFLAEATARLNSPSPDPDEALALANEAEQALPGRAPPSSLRGRALMLLGRDHESIEALREAERRDPRALDDPLVLLALGRSLGRTGATAAAFALYQKLLPRISTGLPIDRATVCLEAAVLALSLGGAHMEEATYFFHQARRERDGSRKLIAPIAKAFGLSPDVAHAVWDAQRERTGDEN